MEKRHLLIKRLLLVGTAVPAAESAMGIFWQRPVIDFQRFIEQLANGFERRGGIDQRREWVDNDPIKSVWLRMALRSEGGLTAYCERAR
jgi:hypothetical protein